MLQIPDSSFTKFNETLDYLISSGIGVQITVKYPVERITCPNCILNTITGRSSGKYKSGGPIPFSAGVCPYCKGDGYIEQRETDTFNAIVEYNIRDYSPSAPGVNIPSTRTRIIGMSDDLEKVVKGDTFSIQNNSNEYKKAGEPQLRGLDKSSYFEVLLERVL